MFGAKENGLSTNLAEPFADVLSYSQVQVESRMQCLLALSLSFTLIRLLKELYDEESSIRLVMKGRKEEKGVQTAIL